MSDFMKGIIMGTIGLSICGCIANVIDLLSEWLRAKIAMNISLDTDCQNQDVRAIGFEIPSEEEDDYE